MFDGDCDGWLSREELVAAITHLTAMRGVQDNATPTTLTVSNGEASPTPSPAPEGHSPAPEGQQECDRMGKEEIADSALQNYGKTKVWSTEKIRPFRRDYLKMEVL